MTPDQQYLVTQMISECCEVAHILTKVQQFGLDEQCPGLDKTNRDRSADEVIDLQATMELLQEEGVLSIPQMMTQEEYRRRVEAKKVKIRRYRDFALHGAEHPKYVHRCAACGYSVNIEAPQVFKSNNGSYYHGGECKSKAPENFKLSQS